MLKTNTRYGYNDVMIQPAVVSDINHRSECNPYIEDGMLPIFTAPMSTVVDTQNYDLFYENHLFAILPRNIDWEIRKEWIYEGKWVAVSLSEFEDFICDEANFSQCPNYYHLRIVIDVANGHMEKIFKLSRIAKIIHGNRLEIMSGNIANPKTYDNYCEACIDYVRVGIGGGAGCITSSNTGIHDGIASLLNDIDNIKVDRRLNGKFCTKVIADGGIRGYSDVIKALALGADYVMIGSLLAQTVESAAPIYKKNRLGVLAAEPFIEVTTKDIRPLNEDRCFGKWIDKDGKVYDHLYKEFYGMASKYGQISINGEKTKTSEGIKKEIEVTTNLDTWVENMTAYLRSAMSYCNITDVKRFTPSRVTVQVISNNTLNSINK